LSGLLATVPFSVVGQPPQNQRDMPSVNLRVITPEYLSAVGTQLMQGRSLSEADTSSTSPVALVSSALANRFLAGDAVGRRLLIDDNSKGPRPVEVVGVVEDVRQSALDGPPSLDVYIPLRQIHADGVPIVRNNHFWMIQTETAPAAFRTTFVSALRAVDPDAAISTTGTMRQYLEAWLAPRRFNLGLFAAFALTAVLLAVSGLYGLVSYTVSQRRREIGVRMAIGATERDIRRLILEQAFRLSIGGAVIGLCLAAAARPVIGRIVRDASIDPLAAVGTSGCLMAVVMLAAWLPARRVTRIQPTLALRPE
jgi:hypothetical protein